MWSTVLIHWFLAWHYLDKFRHQDADVKSFHLFFSPLAARSAPLLSPLEVRIAAEWHFTLTDSDADNVQSIQMNHRPLLSPGRDSTRLSDPMRCADARAHIFRISNHFVSFELQQSEEKRGEKKIKLQLQLQRSGWSKRCAHRVQCLLKF